MEETKSKVNKIVLIGNTGVGKTHILNSFFGDKIWDSKVSITAVTTTIGYKDLKVGLSVYRFYNIPGIMEDDEKNVQENINKMKEVLNEEGTTLLIYVLVLQSGRLNSNDCQVINTLKDSYNLEGKNFLYLINFWDLEWEKEIKKEQVVDRIHKLLSPHHVYFIPKSTGDIKIFGDFVRPTFTLIFDNHPALSLIRKQEFLLIKDKLNAYKSALKKREQKYNQLIVKKEEEYKKRIFEIKAKMAEESKQKNDYEVISRVASTAASVAVPILLKVLGI